MLVKPGLVRTSCDLPTGTDTMAVRWSPPISMARCAARASVTMPNIDANNTTVRAIATSQSQPPVRLPAHRHAKPAQPS